MALKEQARLEIEMGQCRILGVESLTVINNFGKFFQKQQFIASIVKNNCCSLKVIQLKDTS